MQLELNNMNVDGGASQNNFLMQFQSDISNILIRKPENIESTALGAAILAGLKLNIWSRNELLKLKKSKTNYKPSMNSSQRKKSLNGWKKAVEKTKLINWNQ